MAYTVSKELYEKYKHQVIDLSLAVQEYEGTRQKRGLTDAEIAERLGLSERDVTEIRTVAEVDLQILEWYTEAEDFKIERMSKRIG